ncbi:MAG: hypothetical protein R3F62_13625 [Planctomycetota bacterium]
MRRPRSDTPAVTSRGRPLRCAVCHGDFAAEERPCAGCGTACHVECRAELGRCPTPGCREGPAEAPDAHLARWIARTSLPRGAAWKLWARHAADGLYHLALLSVVLGLVVLRQAKGRGAEGITPHVLGVVVAYVVFGGAWGALRWSRTTARLPRLLRSTHPQVGRLSVANQRASLRDLLVSRGWSTQWRELRVAPAAGSKLPERLQAGIGLWTVSWDPLRDAVDTPVAVYVPWEDGPYLLQDAGGRCWLIP